MRPEARHTVWIDRLAAEYVLGTLRGRARHRFERWRASSELVAGHCALWEQRLTPLAERLRPMAPPPETLARIQRHLGLAPPAGLRWASALAVVALLAALLAYWPAMRAPQPDRVATINTPAGNLQWRVEVYTQRARLVVRSPTLTVKPTSRDYELWALPAGAPAVSLGVMPVRGERALALSETQRRALAHALQIAVSVEPLGGSPSGQPTGPVVFVAPLRAAG
ncbi:MAG TPA: anti-sigma factor [Steroidobacteraceae bacterium]|nr:anti-sigma factor [Steroidobacteraceae bacterium]